LFVGGVDIRGGRMTLGELLLVNAYLMQLYGPLRVIGKQVAKHQRSLASLERAFDLLAQAPAVAERPHACALGRARGGIAFRKVSFGYDPAYPILRDIDLEVPAGTRVGIAGATGAGKTTLLSLLTRFYDPTAGTVLLDGVDVADYRLRDLRRQFAIVLQEPVLFSGSIVENIAYAKPEAGEEEIIAAAEAAHAHTFILDLPLGYRTIVGERGMRLSGGERQRISLARAFLKDAPILILDEPTSSVDVRTEALIVEAMGRLMEGRTTFIIAHRLNTLESCDLLVKLEHGTVAWETRAVRPGLASLDTPRPAPLTVA
jgi:ATP-binding cassette, subfamily B, bacterial